MDGADESTHFRNAGDRRPVMDRRKMTPSGPLGDFFGDVGGTLIPSTSGVPLSKLGRMYLGSEWYLYLDRRYHGTVSSLV